MKIHSFSLFARMVGLEDSPTLRDVSFIPMSAHRAPRWVAAKPVGRLSFNRVDRGWFHIREKGWMLGRLFSSPNYGGAEAARLHLVRFQVGQHFVGAVQDLF